jgi:hypothetical protein
VGGVTLRDLRAEVWWTEADAAELDVVAHAFVKAAYVHRERCGTCSSGGPWCLPLREALDGVVEWRHGRVLRSKAAWLRELEHLRTAAYIETEGGLF